MRILLLTLWFLYYSLQTSVAAFSTSQQRPARQARRVQKCFAMAGEDEKKLTFESNKRSVSILSTYNGANEPQCGILHLHLVFLFQSTRSLFSAF